MTVTITRRGALGGLCAVVFAATARAAEAQVNIDNFTFAPATITVAPGTRVTWTNRDDIPHVVVASSTPPSFRSKVLDTGDSYGQLFDKPGTYTYFCALHPHMQGVVVVK